MGVAVDGETHTVYVANSASGDIAVFGDIRPIVTTGQLSEATESEVTLTGHIDPAGRGDINSCYFEYGFDKTYGHTVPCSPDPSADPPGSHFTGPTDVTAIVTGLSPGTSDHYRLVAGNVPGATAVGEDRVLSSTQPPVIDGLVAEDLTATTADIKAQVNPGGLETNYQVEYGTSTDYGQTAPVPAGTLAASNSAEGISVHLEGLTPHRPYHYRLVATNADGTTTVADHVFNFYPPSCPNSNVRQQTQANYLPDCRAYELVSPGNAGGTQLYPGGPNTGAATTPPRFSFTGLWGTIPNTGGSPSNSTGDLYVATRTPTGWVSKYVGLPGNEFATSGGPPQGLPASTNGGFVPVGWTRRCRQRAGQDSKFRPHRPHHGQLPRLERRYRVGIGRTVCLQRRWRNAGPLADQSRHGPRRRLSQRGQHLVLQGSPGRSRTAWMQPRGERMHSTAPAS